jgi:hypothetical protein
VEFPHFYGGFYVHRVPAYEGIDFFVPGKIAKDVYVFKYLRQLKPVLLAVICKILVMKINKIADQYGFRKIFFIQRKSVSSCLLISFFKVFAGTFHFYQDVPFPEQVYVTGTCRAILEQFSPVFVKFYLVFKNSRFFAVNTKYVKKFNLKRLRVRFFPRCGSFALPVVYENGGSCFYLVPRKRHKSIMTFF